MSEANHFAVCINTGEYEGTLQLRKIYEVLPDATAAKHSYIRVVDESGEDYLYPQAWFVPEERRAIAARSGGQVVAALLTGSTSSASAPATPAPSSPHH